MTERPSDPIYRERTNPVPLLLIALVLAVGTSENRVRIYGSSR